jgi:hypothetical protein
MAILAARALGAAYPRLKDNAFHLVSSPVAIHIVQAHACEKAPTQESVAIRQKEEG